MSPATLIVIAVTPTTLIAAHTHKREQKHKQNTPAATTQTTTKRNQLQRRRTLSRLKRKSLRETLKQNCEMDFRGVTEHNILEAVQTHGAAPGGVACMRAEGEAARESLETGLYITYIPQSIDMIAESSVRMNYEATKTQCCRVGSNSVCLCGHKLSDHKPVNKKSKSFIRPPKCDNGKCRCFGFNYMPSRPEECGQWWLPRRRDFDINAWKKVRTLLTKLLQQINT
jgi:hypothetical protein